MEKYVFKNEGAREIIDVFKDCPEVDAMVGRPYIEIQGSDIVIDGRFSLEYLEEKITLVLEKIENNGKQGGR